MADLKSGTTVGGNTIWSQYNLPLVPAGNSIMYKGFLVYSENDKPTKADVGLSNVTNDLQMPKAGGTMTGNLTLVNAATLTVPRRIVLQSDSVGTNPYLVASRFDNNPVVDGYPSSEATVFDLQVKTKSNTSDPNAGAYLVLQRFTQRATGEGVLLIRSYGPPDQTTGASGPGGATILLDGGTGVTTFTGSGVTVSANLTCSNSVIANQINIKGSGNRHIFFQDTNGNELLLLYADSGKNAYIRTGGVFINRFNADGSVVLANTLTVPGTLSVTGTSTVAAINSSSNIRTTADNTTILVGNNGDIGFVKKQSASGAIGVASGNAFRVARSNASGNISASNTYTDILTITPDGTMTIPGEIVSTNMNAFRAVMGNYGFIIRNDQTNTLFMLTNSGDATGGYNSLRPLAINNATGKVTMSNGLSVAGDTDFAGLTTTGGVTFNTSAAAYDITSLGAGALNTKGYLRTFRGGLGSTIFHETVQGQTYRIATGSTDTTEALSLSNTGKLSVSDAVVIRNSTSTPGNNTTTQGGELRSQFNIAGSEASAVVLQSIFLKDSTGVITRRARIAVTGGTPPGDADVLEIGQNGQIFCNGIVSRSPTSGNSSPNLSMLDNSNAGAVLSYAFFKKGGEAGVRRVVNLNRVSLDPNDLAVLSVGGGYSCRAGISGPSRLTEAFNFDWVSGSGILAYIDTSNVGTIQMQSTCDAELKKDIVYVSDNKTALAEVMQWKPATFKYKSRGVIPESDTKLSFIANDLIQTSPETVKGEGIAHGADIQDNDVFAKSYVLDKDAIIAKLTLALQATNDKMEAMQKEIAELRSMVMAK